MSESREKKARYNQKLEYIARFREWLAEEPPIIFVISWHRWKRQRPQLEFEWGMYFDD